LKFSFLMLYVVCFRFEKKKDKFHMVCYISDSLSKLALQLCRDTSELSDECLEKFKMSNPKK
jgi:hypothetical protein